MELESVSCDHCGAPLEVPPSANYVTCAHCDRQLRIHRTETARYTEVLEALAKRTDELSDHVAQLRLQNEIAALDRAWDHEKETYMVTGKHGHRSLPTKTGSVIGGVFLVIFGCIWTAMAAQMAGGFALFGVIFIALGAFMSIHSYGKAERYERALRRYQQQRGELQRRLREQESH
jgi:hypothetical protein